MVIHQTHGLPVGLFLGVRVYHQQLLAMNRRDFLDPRNLAEAAGYVLGAVDELQVPEIASADDEVALLRAAHPAMATTFELLLLYGTASATAVAAAAFAEIDRLEKDHAGFSFHRSLVAAAEIAPTMPVGNSMTRSTRTTPSKSCQYSVAATAYVLR